MSKDGAIERWLEMEHTFEPGRKQQLTMAASTKMKQVTSSKPNLKFGGGFLRRPPSEEDRVSGRRHGQPCMGDPITPLFTRTV